ncbi:glycine-rich domain-containing protein [Caballeronia zhejiangensis]|uniref:glycine-rich domain-containing protein n=1 Tax=Caballeronia zhejiangensis TaxID=871203 RepID=UPI001EF6D59F|nr:hypothetical protein [Caballeronia zhejiangensis]MCG7400252.1 hypothetical protein [Caballeronia zhejiangensis]
MVITAANQLKVARMHDLRPVIARFCESQQETPERAERIADELRHFLVLCARSKDEGYAIRDPIDEMWHTFLIFTKDYFTFCSNLGKRYIHHEPVGDRSDPDAGKTRLESYQRLLADYERTFGYPPPADIWPEATAEIMKGPDCGKGCSYWPPCCNKS